MNKKKSIKKAVKKTSKTPIKKKSISKIKSPSQKTLKAYNKLVKSGIPVILNKDGNLVIDLKKVNIKISYTKSGNKYMSYELREEGAELLPNDYESILEILKNMYSYIKEYEKDYYEENPELCQLINEETLGITTEMQQHLVTMNLGLKVILNFLENRAFLIQAYENGKVQIIN